MTVQSKLLTLFITALFFFSQYCNIALAKSAESNEVKTCVGNVSKDQCDNSSSSSNNNLVKAAQDLHDAYISCSNGTGKTTITANLSGCLHDQLEKKGYSEGNIAGTASNLTTYEAQGCVQCIGFVRQALFLAYGHESTLEGNAGDNYYSPSITVGSHIFKNLGSVPAKTGDIAVASGSLNSCNSSEQICGAGHILIVKETEGKIKFTALESNWSYINGVIYPEPHCVATDFVAHPYDVYHIFREQ